MNFENKTILISGANRGIGRALVDEALKRGARRVYAGTRKPLGLSDSRVVPLTLDVTNSAQIGAAFANVEALDIHINNAGQDQYAEIGNRAAFEQLFAVNFFGLLDVTRAFLPLIRRARGAIVNNLSLAALAPLPMDPAYCASKAAAFSLTQALRGIVAEQGVAVHAALTGPVDTDMTRGLNIPKASPASVAQAIFDGVARGEEEIFPDPWSASLAEAWRNGPAKALERQLAQFKPN